MKNPFRRLKSYYQSGSTDNAFRLDGAVPLSRAIPFGIQHVLSMFVANVAPVLICMSLVQADAAVTTNAIQSAVFMAAVATTIQLFPIGPIGGRLPIVCGTSFTFLGVVAMVGSSYGLGTMFLSIVIGGLIIGILGLFASKWRRFIKPIVSAVVVLGLGLSLLKVGINDFLSLSTPGIVDNGVYQFGIAWPYLLVAFITLLTGILWQVFVKGVWKNVSILVGLAVGYIVALCFTGYNHMVDFSALTFSSVTDFINVPRPFFTLFPVQWSDFKIGAILVVLLIYVVSTTEGIGSISSLTSSGLGREPTDREISGGTAASGFASAFAGFFGAMPLSPYAQNVGIVNQTKVVNRFVIFMSAIVLFLASLFPPISRFLQTIPQAVLGGTMLMLFSSIVLIGMQMIASIGFTKKNVLIASLSVGLGYGLTLVPSFTAGTYEVDFVNYLMLVLQNPVANMFIISLLLSYIIPDSFNNEDKPKEA